MIEFQFLHYPRRKIVVSRGPSRVPWLDRQDCAFRMAMLEDQSPGFPSLCESGRYRCAVKERSVSSLPEAPGVAIAQRAEGLLGISKNIIAS